MNERTLVLIAEVVEHSIGQSAIFPEASARGARVLCLGILPHDHPQMRIAIECLMLELKEKGWE